MRDGEAQASANSKARVSSPTLTARVLCSALALVVLAPAGRGQFVVASAGQCPTVRVVCPDTSAQKAPLTFSAELAGVDPEARLSFKWTVAGGTIASGQGTRTVTVEAIRGVEGHTAVTATVEVGGLPGACSNTASCTLLPGYPVTARQLDEYGDIHEGDEKARLDMLAIALHNEPTARGYLFCYGGRRGRRGAARTRCQRAKRYMSELRGIEARRIVTVDGGFREVLTVTLWVVPAGAQPPTPAPTVRPSDVRFVGARRVRKRRHVSRRRAARVGRKRAARALVSEGGPRVVSPEVE